MMKSEPDKYHECNIASVLHKLKFINTSKFWYIVGGRQPKIKVTINRSE